MFTSIIAVVAALGNIATWYFTRRGSDNAQKAIKKGLVYKYDLLLSKYTELIKERNSLRRSLQEAEETLYEEANIANLIDTINSLPSIGGGDDSNN